MHVDFELETYSDNGMMKVLKDVEKVCASFGILHCTIQMECTYDVSNRHTVKCC